MIEKRVVYRVPNMDQVVVRQDVEYKGVSGSIQRMDIYYPPGLDETSRSPAVIFVLGYRDSTMLKMLGSKLKDIGQYVSWGELLAASGIVGIAYETTEPHSDVQELIEHIRKNATSLRIDPDRLGLWSCSGNVPTALSVLMDESRDYLRCAVLYYGFMLDWGDSRRVSENAERIGFEYPCETRTVEDLTMNIPLLVVKAGLDKTPDLNESIEQFLIEAKRLKVPIDFVEYEDGQHAFDILEDTETSRSIIKHTISFMKGHLSSSE
ncbi:MAG: alpha/beta hydrolase [Candidatus Thorarchaeota archaeon]